MSMTCIKYKSNDRYNIMWIQGTILGMKAWRNNHQINNKNPNNTNNHHYPHNAMQKSRRRPRGQSKLDYWYQSPAPGGSKLPVLRIVAQSKLAPNYSTTWTPSKADCPPWCPSNRPINKPQTVVYHDMQKIVKWCWQQGKTKRSKSGKFNKQDKIRGIISFKIIQDKSSTW